MSPKGDKISLNRSEALAMGCSYSISVRKSSLLHVQAVSIAMFVAEVLLATFLYLIVFGREE